MDGEADYWMDGVDDVMYDPLMTTTKFCFEKDLIL